jgi:hypothetical protein
MKVRPTVALALSIIAQSRNVRKFDRCLAGRYLDACGSRIANSRADSRIGQRCVAPGV